MDYNNLSDEELDNLVKNKLQKEASQQEDLNLLSDEELDARVAKKLNQQTVSNQDQISPNITPSGAMLGYSAAGSVGNKIASGSKALASRLGPYSENQLQTILDNFTQFNELDRTQVEKSIEGSFRNLNRDINELHKQAFSNFKGSLPESKFLDIVQTSVEPFGSKIDPNLIEEGKKQAIQSTIQSMSDRLNSDIQLKVQQALDRQLTEQAKEIQAARNAGQYKISNPVERQNELLKIKEEIRPTAKLDISKAESEALVSMKDSLSIPKEIKIDENELLKKYSTNLSKKLPKLIGKNYTPEQTASIQELISMFPENTVPKERNQIYELVQELNDPKNYGDRLKDATKKTLRDYVALNSPESSELLRQESAKLKQLNELQDIGYLKKDKGISKQLDEFIQVGEPEIKKIYSDIGGNKLRLSDDVVERLSKLKQVLTPEQYRQVELSAYKSIMQDPKKALKVSPVDAALAIFSPTGAGVTVGTKAAKTPEGSIRLAKVGQDIGKSKGLKVAGAAALGSIGAIPQLLSAVESYKKGDNITAALQAGAALDPIGVLDVAGEASRRVRQTSTPEQLKQQRKSDFKAALPLGLQDEMISESLYDESMSDYIDEKQQELNKLNKNKAVITDSDVNSLSEAKAIANSDEKYRAFADLLEQFDEMTKDQQDKAMFAMQQQPAFRQMRRQNQDKVK